MVELQEVTKQEPCRHCGKPDWCYRLNNGLEVCNRGNIADGWQQTKKQDSQGNFFLSPIKEETATPNQTNFRRWVYTNRSGEPLVRVNRRDFDNGNKKIFQQGQKNGRWVQTIKHINRSEVAIYRYEEIQQAISQDRQIFFVEGEPCVDILWEMGIPATTNLGGSARLQESDLLDLERANLVICPDCDLPGLKLAEKIYSYYPHSQWLYAFPSHRNWQKENIPSSDGFDIYDWIKDYQISVDQIYDAIEIYRGNLLGQKIQDFAPEAEQHYTEKAIEALYSDGNYVAIEDSLYKFNGKHYEKLGTKLEQRKIADWCRCNPVEVGVNRWKFSYSSASSVNNIWNWVLIRFGVERTDVNPPGLNLKNGVLQVNIEKKNATWKLIDHTPNNIYTYCVDVNYNPDANTEDVERLLSCLDETQVVVLLRTLAASLNLNGIRKVSKHRIKALLLQGEGSNGKDSLREVTALLFNESMVSLSIGDFKDYDQGNKNSLVQLVNAKISWSSENSKFSTLENAQSLKNSITGETLTVKYLYENPQEVKPCSVFLFNCNEAPSLVGGTEAIKSRWAIIKFTKVFKKEADLSKGEIESDPRFRYDPDFLKEKVAPPFLNKILKELPLLLKEGIDYSSTDEALQEIQSESNHLWQFCKDRGIGYVTGGKFYINDIWKELKEWYVETGTIEVFYDESGKEKVVWHDQVNSHDKTIKGPNQIYKRFAELFPKVKKLKETTVKGRFGQAYLESFGKTGSVDSEVHEIKVTASELPQNSEPLTEATTKSYRASESTEPVLGKTFSYDFLVQELKKQFSGLSADLQHNLINDLTNLINRTGGNSSSESENESSTRPNYVRFQEEIFKVISINSSGKITLGKSGMGNRVYGYAHLSQCEIIE